MRQKQGIKGYSKRFWSGITTLELAKQIDKIIELPNNLTGLYHLAPDFCITKHTLLKYMVHVFNKNIIVKANDNIYENKVLINNRKKEYDPQIPPYYYQLLKLKEWLKL